MKTYLINGRIKMHGNFFFVLLVINFLIALQSTGQTFPSGFSQVKIATIYYPTSMAFAPDGRIFVTEKAGKVKIIKNGNVLSTPFCQVSVDQLNERGLGAITLDPDFSNNKYVYVYYTSNSGGIIRNKLTRFTANGDVALSGSEVVLLEVEPSVNSIHNGGGMKFGPDGKLYIGIGNDNVNSNSQDLNTYKGKVLRINPDGSAPSGNPYTGSEAAKRIWDYGFRNPWTLDIQPGSGKVYVNDVGEASWEEINDVTASGKNYGWPAAEGMSGNSAYTNPVYTYPHGTGLNAGCAISGGTFFNSSSSNYPGTYSGKYFFIDYCNHWINYIDPANPSQNHNFASSLQGSCNYIKEGNDGNLYYFSISQSALYKIIYNGNTTPPSIISQPAGQTVSQGQPASFSVTASGSSPLTYQWKKNNVNISGANSSTFTINNVQPSDAGQYKVAVANPYGSVESNSATLNVSALNLSPVATINSPANGMHYRSGDIINFSGSGSDAEDGNMAASAFNWIVEFHHLQHIHPGPYIPPGTTSGSFSTEFGETSASCFFRLILIITDSQGATDTASVDIVPVTSMLTLNSTPQGLQILLDGQPHTTPYSVSAVSGMTRSINVVTPQAMGGNEYVFDHWSQGGSVSQTVTIGDNDQTFMASFDVNTSAINETQVGLNEHVSIFPNPSAGQFTLLLDECVYSGNQQTRYCVYDGMGNCVLASQLIIAPSGGVSTHILDLGKQSKGIYFVEIDAGRKKVRKKVVIE